MQRLIPIINFRQYLKDSLNLTNYTFSEKIAKKRKNDELHNFHVYLSKKMVRNVLLRMN